MGLVTRLVKLLSFALMALILSMLPSVAAVDSGKPAFGGSPPLGPQDRLRHELRPYDLIKLNYLGMNYCENLLDMRLNITSYTHLDHDTNHQDAWNLQFPDDSARLLEGIAWEDQFSPVVRLELARRIVKGIIAAHVPGTKDYYFFRHRSGGKTFLISDDSAGSKQGRLMLINWGDAVEDGLKVGFRVPRGNKWLNVDEFKRSDDPTEAGSQKVIRSPRYWNESPFVFKRHYTTDQINVDFTGRYWLSDEDMPFEFAFKSQEADHLQIVIGEPGKPMPLFGGSAVPGIIHLPDRKTAFCSSDGDKVFENPGFNYMIIRKPTNWTGVGYSTALLIMWEGRPEKVEAVADSGCGEIRISYLRKDGRTGGKIWLYPFQWVNHKDMGYIYRNAEHFLKAGKLLHNGFPTQQAVNAIPAGLAAGAFLLTKYGDPMAVTARIHATNVVDALFDAEQDGMKLHRVFFCAKAAAWMVKTGKLTDDKQMVDRCTAYLDRAMLRMLSPATGYDGKAWASGWDHFNCAKAAWLAYDATEKNEYLDVYERALTVYTIDPKGIYRYGVPMQAPGGFETYSGALPLSLWGHAGRIEWVDTLINLDVPNGWHFPRIPVKDTWNDAGAGPWAQDDANPDFVGFCLKGMNIPQRKKYILPLGTFPVYDAAGNVELTRRPILENPFLPSSNEKLVVLAEGRRMAARKVTTLVVRPGDKQEKKHLIRPAGTIKGGKRVCVSANGRLVYQFDTRGASGAGIDMRIRGDGYQVEISPDGKRWYKRLDTWSDNFRNQSLDLSVLTGTHDEMLKLLEIVPGDDGKYLKDSKLTTIKREHCRYIESSGSFVYKLDLPEVTECHLELMLGNDYKVQCSSDGKAWRNEPCADQHKWKAEPDAAWLEIVDVTKYLKNGKVYVRFSGVDAPEASGAPRPFLRRLTAYGVFNSGKAFVKLSNVSDTRNHALAVERLVFRTW